MQKSGFFNALLSGNDYDRKYNANDYSDNLAVVISNGVLRSTNDDLKVTSNGLVVTVGVGRAWINGHYYLNDTAYSFTVATPPTAGARYDRILLRLDNSISVRSVSIVYQQGTAGATPKKPDPVRSGDIYDLVLADLYITANATSIVVTDTRSNANLCGWVYSTSGDNSFFTSLDNSFNEWFEDTKTTLATVTLFKRYNWRTVLETATQSVNFNIPQYDPETSYIDVYINGTIMTSGVDYNILNNTITFPSELIAGTEIEIKCYKSIDGTGIMSVADEITELQNQVAALSNTSEYNYICNGNTDNVILSDIAQEWLNGGTDYGCKKINVFGTLGIKKQYAGSGTAASPYRFFALGSDTAKNRRIIFDFSNCSEINVPVTSGYNTVFHGLNVHIIGANVIVNQALSGVVVSMFNSLGGAVRAENCRFWLTAYQDSIIAHTGTFINCRASVANVTGDSVCFAPTSESLLQIKGGEYYCYTGASASSSAILGQKTADGVAILYGVNAPILARSGYYQTNSIIQYAGFGISDSILSCTDLISTLPLNVIAGASNIRGTITKNKPSIL